MEHTNLPPALMTVPEAASHMGVSRQLVYIMAQTRHQSVTVARRYIRDGSLFRGNAAGQVGL